MKQESLLSEAQTGSALSKKISSRYVHKDPTHGQGFFLYKEYIKKDGKHSYNWSFVAYINGRRQPKEYLGTSESKDVLPVSKNCTAKHKELFAQINRARAYKKHSTQ